MVLGIEDIVAAKHQNRFRWYAHVLEKDEDWVKKCRPWKTWKVLYKDMLDLERKCGAAMDCSRQRAKDQGVLVRK